MRKKKYVAMFPAILLAVVVQVTHGQDVGRWDLLSNSPDAGGGRHDDISFVSASTGWLVNLDGEIWKTDDAGETWTLQFDHPELGFRSVGFANELLGWVGTVQTPESVLFETRDGGSTWADITDRIIGPATSGICGFAVVSDSVAYGAGAYFGEPHVVKTVDGGQTWTSTRITKAATLVDIHFFDESLGYAVGGTGPGLTGEVVVLRTTNGGQDWGRVYTGVKSAGIGGEWGWKISFPTPQIGYVSVEYLSNTNGFPAKVMKTFNGGLTWTPLIVSGSTQDFGLQGLGFVNDKVGWSSGRGTTSMTEDGGLNWETIPPYTEQGGQLDGNVNRIRVVNDSLAFAIGQRVYRYGSVPAPTPVAGYEQPAALFELDQNYPNPFGPSTNIGFTLYREAAVRIAVHDVRGRRVRTLVERRQGPGRYDVAWDGRDDSGARVASGVYIYLVDIGEAIEMKQMVMLRGNS